MKRIVALPALSVALMLTLAAAVVVSLAAGVPNASAYFLANGCDVYDEYNGKIYWCTPDRTTYYTPDGLNPSWVYPGTEGKTFGDDLGEGLTINDSIGIPPPAPFSYSRDYCSEPDWLPATFEGRWQRACYDHDVCYGSQKGRLYCDVRLWRDMVFACRSMWASNFVKEWCMAEADTWYTFVRAFGAAHYKPRLSSYEP